MINLFGYRINKILSGKKVIDPSTRILGLPKLLGDGLIKITLFPSEIKIAWDRLTVYSGICGSRDYEVDSLLDLDIVRRVVTQNPERYGDTFYANCPDFRPQGDTTYTKTDEKYGVIFLIDADEHILTPEILEHGLRMETVDFRNIHSFEGMMVLTATNLKEAMGPMKRLLTIPPPQKEKGRT